MKTHPTILKSFSIVVLIAMVVVIAGCASDSQSKQDLAAAAGFKIITPTKPDQVAILSTLPADKVTPVTYQGKTYFVLPDAQNNRAYVGGQAEYQSYQQLRVARQISNDNLMAAQMNQSASMNWGAWGGWGYAAPLGFRR